ncbi:MAG: hypothetical protein RL385_2681 [Pseudomonadota bacterium]
MTTPPNLRPRTARVLAAHALVALAPTGCTRSAPSQSQEETLPTYAFVPGEAEPQAEVTGEVVREDGCFYLTATPSYRHWIAFPSGISRFDEDSQTLHVGAIAIKLGQRILGNGAEGRAPTKAPAACKGEPVLLGSQVTLLAADASRP